MSKQLLKIIYFTGLILSPEVSHAENSIKLEGTSPKLTLGKAVINFNGRAEIDTYDLKTDFGELSGQKSRDYSRNLTALKRAFISADIKFNPSLKFRGEYQFMQDKPAWTDAYFEYTKPNLSVFIGNNHQANSIEGQTSPSLYNFTQRSLMTLAFAQSNRNLGIAVRKYAKNYQVTAAIFGDSVNLPSDRYFSSNAGFQLRGSYVPINEKGNIIHIGGSFRYREHPDNGLYGYNARPIQFIIGPQNVQTGNIAKSDYNFGVETYIVKGPLNIMAEAQINKEQTNNGDLNFSGGYLDVSYTLTGEARSYNAVRGVMGSLKPKKSVFAGGIGAVSILGRFEYLDLSDGNLGNPNAPITSWRNRGGKEYGYTLGVNYYLAERTLIHAAYSHTKIEDSRGFINQNNNLISNPIGNGKSDLFSIRTQIGF